MYKLCIFCRHCAFDTRERRVRDGGVRGSIWCGSGKRTPDVSAPLVGQHEFLEWISLAESCKYFTMIESAHG